MKLVSILSIVVFLVSFALGTLVATNQNIDQNIEEKINQNRSAMEQDAEKTIRHINPTSTPLSNKIAESNNRKGPNTNFIHHQQLESYLNSRSDLQFSKGHYEQLKKWEDQLNKNPDESFEEIISTYKQITDDPQKKFTIIDLADRLNVKADKKIDFFKDVIDNKMNVDQNGNLDRNALNSVYAMEKMAKYADHHDKIETIKQSMDKNEENTDEAKREIMIRFFYHFPKEAKEYMKNDQKTYGEILNEIESKSTGS